MIEMGNMHMQALTLLIKPVSGSCNMRCRYCFYADVTDIRTVKNYGMMSHNTLERIVERALSEATGSCSFGFQGGEPTLAGLDFYRTLMVLEKRYNRNNVKITHSLQTNGLLINEEWAEFLAANHFLTGLSIDGTKAIHDGLRFDAQGKGTHNRCLQTARLLRKAGAQYNILTVVTRQLAAHPDRLYSFYNQQGFEYIQLIPCLDGLEEAHGSHPYSLDTKTYGKFLCRIFDLWYDDFVKGRYRSIRAFDNYIHILAGHPPENCAMGGICSAYALVEADGSVYPCDFYAVDKYRLGNVAADSFEEVLTGDVARGFVQPSRQVHPECGGCMYFSICRGGCRRDREPLTDGVPALNHYCGTYKIFFPHALPRMREIALRVFG